MLVGLKLNHQLRWQYTTEGIEPSYSLHKTKKDIEPGYELHPTVYTHRTTGIDDYWSYSLHQYAEGVELSYPLH